MQQSARAELWAYVDERGVTNFASEQVDARYQLFFKGTQFDSARDAVPGAPGAAGAVVAGKAGEPGLRLKSAFSHAPDYARAQPHVHAAAQRHGLDAALLSAVIATESGFDAGAVSPKGAVGLMQVMPVTASRFGVNADQSRSVAQKLADPAVNIPVGARVLRYLVDLFPGRLDLAVAAYNAGEGAVRRAGNAIPAFKETQNYVRTVLDLYAQLQPTTPRAGSTAARVRASAAATPASGRIRMQLQGQEQRQGGALGRGNLPLPELASPSGLMDEKH